MYEAGLARGVSEPRPRRRWEQKLRKLAIRRSARVAGSDEASGVPGVDAFVTSERTTIIRQAPARIAAPIAAPRRVHAEGARQLRDTSDDIALLGTLEQRHQVPVAHRVVLRRIAQLDDEIVVAFLEAIVSAQHLLPEPLLRFERARRQTRPFSLCTHLKGPLCQRLVNETSASMSKNADFVNVLVSYWQISLSVTCI